MSNERIRSKCSVQDGAAGPQGGGTLRSAEVPEGLLERVGGGPGG